MSRTKELLEDIQNKHEPDWIINMVKNLEVLEEEFYATLGRYNK
jgi:hypothetical protein